MTLDFPNSPIEGQEYTNPLTSVVYTYSSAKDLWTGLVGCPTATLGLYKPVIDDTIPTVDDVLATTADAYGGVTPYTYTYQWKADTVDISGATNQSYTVAASEVGKTITVTVTVTDLEGTVASSTSDATSSVAPNVLPPLISSVSLVENEPAGDRFTSQGFTTTATMTTEGIPAPDFALKGYVEGTLAREAITDDITNVVSGTTGDAWVATVPPLQQWTTIAYGGGVYVTVGGGGWTMNSTDGINWGTATTPSNWDWNSVTYGNGKFVAVCGNGTNNGVVYSSNGTSWTESNSTPKANVWTAVTYGAGKYVALSGSGSERTMYSTDAINWTSGNNGDGGNWSGVAYGNGKFVAVGGPAIMTSSDGITWDISDPQAGDWNAITYADGKFVAVGGNGTNRVMYSTDGTNWNGVPAIESSWFSVTYGNGVFVATTGYGPYKMMWSVDGISWNGTTIPDEADWKGNSITYGDGPDKFVAIAGDGDNRSMYSTSGTGIIGSLSLIFATDKDLAYFSAGDSVSQDAPVTPVTSAITNVNSAVNSPQYTAGSSNWDQVSASALLPFYVTDSYLSAGMGSTQKIYTFNSTDGSTVGDPVSSAPFGSNYTASYVKGSGDTVYAISGDGYSPIKKSTEGGLNWSSYGSATIQADALNVCNPTPVVNGNLYWIQSKNLRYVQVTTPPVAGDIIQVSGASPSGNTAMVALSINETTGGYVYTNGDQWAYCADLSQNQVLGTINTSSSDPNTLRLGIKTLTNSNGTYIAATEDGLYTSSSPNSYTDWTLQGLNSAYPWASDVSTGNDYVSGMYVDNSGRLLVQVWCSAGGKPYSGVWVSNTASSPTPSSFTYVDTGSTTVNVQAMNPAIIDGSSNGGRVVVANGKNSGTLSSIFGGTETVLTLTDNTQLNNFQVGDSVTETSGDGTGTVTAIGATSLSLSPYGGTWSNGSTVTGVLIDGTATVDSTNTSTNTMVLSNYTYFAVGSKATGIVTVENSKLYTVMNSTGQITDLVEADPGFVTQLSSTSPWGITFPALFPSGDTPDVALPAGTSFTVDLQAINTVGTSTKTSNAVVPVSASGIAGTFATKIYTGNSTSQTIITGVDLSGGEEGLIWIKSIDNDYNHMLTDTLTAEESVANTTSGISNKNLAYQDFGNSLYSFNDDGFSTGSVSNINGTGDYVSWSFKATPQFFDCVKYTGDGASTHAISHNLTSTPGFMIVKSLDSTSNWRCYHVGLGGPQYVINLDETDAKADTPTIWDSTIPSVGSFTVGSNANVNKLNDEFIAYLFAEDTAGMIKCGQFTSTANGSASVNDVGFKPAWLLVKPVSSGDWKIFDQERGFNGATSPFLQPNDYASETDWAGWTAVSDGFLVGPGSTGGGDTLIYVAIATPPDGLFSSEDATELANYNALKSLFDGYPTRKTARRDAYNTAIATLTSNLTSSQMTTLRQFES